MALVVLLKRVNIGGYRTFGPTLVAQQRRRFDVVNVGAAGTFVVRKLVKLDGLLGVPSTARSWNTMLAIARLLEDRAAVRKSRG